MLIPALTIFSLQTMDRGVSLRLTFYRKLTAKNNLQSCIRGEISDIN